MSSFHQHLSRIKMENFCSEFILAVVDTSGTLYESWNSQSISVEPGKTLGHADVYQGGTTLEIGEKVEEKGKDDNTGRD